MLFIWHILNGNIKSTLEDSLKVVKFMGGKADNQKKKGRGRS